MVRTTSAFGIALPTYNVRGTEGTTPNRWSPLPWDGIDHQGPIDEVDRIARPYGYATLDFHGPVVQFNIIRFGAVSFNMLQSRS